MSFILKGYQISVVQWKGLVSNPRRQSMNIEMKYKAHIKLVHELYGTCLQYNVKKQEPII